MSTRRMTVGQALIEFLAHQWTVDEIVHADGTVIVGGIGEDLLGPLPPP